MKGKKYTITEAANHLGVSRAAVHLAIQKKEATCQVGQSNPKGSGDWPMTFLSDVWCGCKWTLVAACILLAAVLAGWYVGPLLWPSSPATQAKCLDSVVVCRRLN